jgi:hypothetical protein
MIGKYFEGSERGTILSLIETTKMVLRRAVTHPGSNPAPLKYRVLRFSLENNGPTPFNRAVTTADHLTSTDEGVITLNAYRGLFQGIIGVRVQGPSKPMCVLATHTHALSLSLSLSSQLTPFLQTSSIRIHHTAHNHHGDNKFHVCYNISGNAVFWDVTPCGLPTFQRNTPPKTSEQTATLKMEPVRSFETPATLLISSMNRTLCFGLLCKYK